MHARVLVCKKSKRRNDTSKQIINVSSASNETKVNAESASKIIAEVITDLLNDVCENEKNRQR